MKVSYCPACGRERIYRIDTFDDRYDCFSCGRVVTVFQEVDFDAEAFEQHLKSMGDLFDGLKDEGEANFRPSNNRISRAAKGGAA